MLHLEDDIISDKPLIISFTQFCLCSIFAIITCFTHLFFPDYSFMDTHLYILVGNRHPPSSWVNPPPLRLTLFSYHPPCIHQSVVTSLRWYPHMIGPGSYPSFPTHLIDHPNFPWCGPQPYPWNFKLNSCFWPQPPTHSTLPSLWFQQNMLATRCKPPSNQPTPPPKQGAKWPLLFLP